MTTDYSRWGRLIPYDPNDDFLRYQYLRDRRGFITGLNPDWKPGPGGVLNDDDLADYKRRRANTMLSNSVPDWERG